MKYENDQRYTCCTLLFKLNGQSPQYIYTLAKM